MRSVTTAILAAAIAAVAASAAQADSQGDFMFLNYFNSSNDPHATTNGLIWIDTGNGVPFLTPNPAYSETSWPPPASDTIWDLNIELVGGTTPDNLAELSADPSSGGGSPSCTTLLLKSIPYSDAGTPNAGQYDTCCSPNPGGFNDPSLGYVYKVPGAASGSAYFQLRAWSGDFTSFSAALLGGALVGQTPVFVNPTQYWIMPIPDLEQMPALILRPSLPGDANLDGKVDINDLSVVLTNYDKSGLQWSQGDFNGDGKVDINDLSVVLTNYDQTAGSAAAGMAAVPEPSILVLAALGAAGLLAYTRRKRV